ncbi:unnamed protein product [Linum trigynum]|uniref:Uncharacterized protein n=1 Tax=Linum trigynum TaxID=586398 RepID=A0AAV2CGR6_9ROSI
MIILNPGGETKIKEIWEYHEDLAGAVKTLFDDPCDREPDVGVGIILDQEEDLNSPLQRIIGFHLLFPSLRFPYASKRSRLLPGDFESAICEIICVTGWVSSVDGSQGVV